MNVEHVEATARERSAESISAQRPQAGLGKSPSRGEGKSAANPDHLPLGVGGTELGADPGARAAGQDGDVDPALLQHVAQVAQVLLHAAKSWIVALGYQSDTKWSHPVWLTS